MLFAAQLSTSWTGTSVIIWASANVSAHDASAASATFARGRASMDVSFVSLNLVVPQFVNEAEVSQDLRAALQVDMDKKL
jgi:hypothetical protein